MSGNKDIFIINKIFPNAKDIFTISGKSTSEIKNDCLFVFDTNSLILPYTTSSESLDEIKKVYTKIIQEKRFFIPGQVAREFARIRPEKIKEVFQQLTKSRNSIPVLGIGKYPLLNGINDYDELFEKEKEINSLVKNYAKQLGKVIEHVKEWSWNDPVSQLYKSLFNDEVIYDIELDEEKITAQLNYRYENRIPPGYEDKNKEDGGIGDLLIWFTILQLAERHKKDIVFVSGDEKKDWFYQVDKQSLYPKFELITEFRTKAPDKSFSIIKLSELLILFDADKSVVDEVKHEEDEQLIHDIIKNNTFTSQYQEAESLVYQWIIKNIGPGTLSHNSPGFPDFTHLKADNTKTAIEMVYAREVTDFSEKFKRVLNSGVSMAISEGFGKFIIVLVIKPMLLIKDIIEKSNEIFGKNESQIEIELIFGYIRNNEFIELPI